MSGVGGVGARGALGGVGARGALGVVGVLVVVEFASGVLQGYYVPQLTDIARALDIADADVNWLEGGQLALSVVALPILAKLGDLVGHRRMLLVALAVTAVASLGLAFATTFPVFLTLWAVQGVYGAWLPLEIALIAHRARTREDPQATTRAGAGVVVAALEAGAIAGALAGGSAQALLGSLRAALLVPGVLVVVALLAVLIGVRSTGERAPGRLDGRGAVLLGSALAVLTGALSLLRLQPGSGLGWGVLLLGLVLLAVFVLVERRVDDPLIDMRVLARPAVWPIQLAALLFGVSVLGAQGPLSTFVRTDPAAVGYGLGLSSGMLSVVIGAYVLALLVGALLLGPVSRLAGTLPTLIAGSTIVAVGYLALVPFHASLAEVLVAMVIAGLGSGTLVAALPAAAAAVAPAGRTAVATGLTNTGKSLGGAFASCGFAIALATGAPAGGTAGSYAGYLTVWAVCGGTALVGAVALLVVPAAAFPKRAAA
ncbi:MFS transporter [Amnibacterium kyonggiense]|uniref:MFS transporter n=1 Tax=Amnibacterium kyonggiense TaxID=595671 RepID=UPI001060ECA0|nr:MFS transporter [Amnibacterium kyonggiense]